MYACDERKMIFLAHPKTASTAVSNALVKRLGFHNCSFQHPDISTGGRGHHRRLKTHPGPQWKVITTVRNHFDAWVSWWFFVDHPIPFGIEAIQHMSELRASSYLRDHRMWGLHRPFADIILRFETLQADLDRALGEHVPLERMTVSEKRERRHYREFYDESTVRYVETIWGEEMNELGYKY